MNELVITVVGRDRPGIIADVSGILAGLGFNLTDSTMTLLRGHFAMTLICAGESAAVDVEAALKPLTEDGLLTMVRTVPVEDGGTTVGQAYVLTVHGADRLGIVSAVTRVLADFGGNVTDLTTRLTGSLYLLVAEVEFPVAVDMDEVAERLDVVGQQLGVRLNLRPAEADVL